MLRFCLIRSILKDFPPSSVYEPKCRGRIIGRFLDIHSGEQLKGEREKLADKYFSCSDSERAAFEAGIKLGTIYHQFVGTPINRENAELLERAIAEGTKIQPFVRDAEVHIEKSQLRSKKGEFDYISLSGPMLSVRLVVQYKDVKVIARMKHVPEIHYPLMYIESIE